MKKQTLILTMLIALTLMSFKSHRPSEKLKLKTGVYGICNCDSLSKSSLKIELTINEDFTFHYFNNSIPTKILDVQGSWTLNDNTVFLKDYHSDFPINNKWTIDKNGKCLKSRKGLEFSRLCHIKSCK